MSPSKCTRPRRIPTPPKSKSRNPRNRHNQFHAYQPVSPPILWIGLKMTLGGIFICAVLESINRDPKLSPDHESIFPDAEIESDQCVSENDLSSLSIARRIASLTPHRFYFKNL